MDLAPVKLDGPEVNVMNVFKATMEAHVPLHVIAIKELVPQGKMELELVYVIQDFKVLLVINVLLDLLEIIVILLVILIVILMEAITFVVEQEMDLAHVMLDGMEPVVMFAVVDITAPCVKIVAKLIASVQKEKLEIVSLVVPTLLATVATVLAPTMDLLAYSAMFVKMEENV